MDSETIQFASGIKKKFCTPLIVVYIVVIIEIIFHNVTKLLFRFCQK